MIISDKKNCIEKVIGKFFLDSLSEEDYKTVSSTLEFIKTYDNIILTIELPQVKFDSVLYYNTERDIPSEITKDLYVDYILKKIPSFERPLWIDKKKNFFELSKVKTDTTVREVNSYEYKEICKVLEDYKDKIIKTANAKYKVYKPIITCFAIWG